MNCQGLNTSHGDLSFTILERKMTSIEWNLMCYTFTDNELEDLSFKDIAKLTHIPQDLSNVHVSILLDTATMGSYHIRIIGNPHLEGNILMTRLPNQNMSDPQTLENFIMKCNPNEYARNALILGGHGSGWFLKTEKDSVLSVPDLAKTIRRTGIIIDLLIFDNCMMSVFESISELTDVAKTIIASEDYAGSNGAIETQTPGFFNDPLLGTETLAIDIAHNLIRILKETDSPTDVSVIRISEIYPLIEFIKQINLLRPITNKFCVDPKYWQLQDLYSIVEESIDPKLFGEFNRLFQNVVIFYGQSINKSNKFHHGLSCIVDPEIDEYDTTCIWKTLKLHLTFHENHEKN